jgi:hypothetical protein
MESFGEAGSNGSLAETKGNTPWQSNALTRPEVPVQLPKPQVNLLESGAPGPKIKRKSPPLPTRFGKPEAVRTDHPKKIGSRRSKHWHSDPHGRERSCKRRTARFSRDNPVQELPEPPIINQDK